MTFEKAKDQVAKEENYVTWNAFEHVHFYGTIKWRECNLKAAELYARSMAAQSLKEIEELKKEIQMRNDYYETKIENLNKAYGNEFKENLELIQQIKDLKADVGKLQTFKDYVHKRLDDAGIEKEPNGEHSKHGCRIGDRLDIALSMAAQAWDDGYTAANDDMSDLNDSTNPYKQEKP